MTYPRVRMIRTICFAAVTFATALNAQSPAVAANVGSPRITSFTPVDSAILVGPNTSATSYTVALVHALSGPVPSEYRVSRFADFRDAAWKPYESRPTIVLASSSFGSADMRTGVRALMLHLQVRARNPRAGQPIAVVGGRASVQPDFFFSDVVVRQIRLVPIGG